MSPSYDIQIAPDPGHVYLRVQGLFDIERAVRFREERDAALLRLTCAPHSHHTLCDVSACLVQPRDAATVFGEMIAAPPRRSRAMTFVVGSALAQLQIKRWAAGREEVSVFDVRAEALEWLVGRGANHLTMAMLMQRADYALV